MTTEGARSEAEVLVIDDDDGLLDLMAMGLTDMGLKVSAANTSVDGLMMVTDTEPTCVIVDLKMPGVDGLDLVSAICSMKRHAVIVLSGYVDVSTTVDVMRLGAYDVLQKPAEIDALSEAVHEALKSLSNSSLATDLTFTRRERQVAELMVHGLTAKQIAQKLDLSPRTVEFFRSSLMRKTQSPNSAALASALTRIGFS